MTLVALWWVLIYPKWKNSSVPRRKGKEIRGNLFSHSAVEKEDRQSERKNDPRKAQKKKNNARIFLSTQRIEKHPSGKEERLESDPLGRTIFSPLDGFQKQKRNVIPFYSYGIVVALMSGVAACYN